MYEESLSIHFSLHREGVLFYAEQDDIKVMNCTFEGGILDFSITYDFRKDEPLHLISKAKSNDKIIINILPYRIEMYIDDFVEDEEWPYGKHFLCNAKFVTNDCSLSIYEGIKDISHKPDIISSFQNAEGWKPEENVFVGDCMPYTHNGKYHVLYLKDRHHHKSKWCLGAHQWEHISTSDFNTWDIHPMAVKIDDSSEASICTGSWILKGNIHYLFYTVRTCDGSPASVRRSVSKDGFHFKKDKDFSFALSDKYTTASTRDPKVIKDEQGKFHMFLTTSLKESANGCLVHLVSDDLNNWTEIDEPLYIAPKSLGEPECPDYFYKDGFYYLVYSLNAKAYYQYSKKPFTEWQLPENPIIPCKSVPKAAIFNDRLIFTGFEPCKEGYYGGKMTFLEAIVMENGELKYKTLDKHVV